MVHATHDYRLNAAPSDLLLLIIGPVFFLQFPGRHASCPFVKKVLDTLGQQFVVGPLLGAQF